MRTFIYILFLGLTTYTYSQHKISGTVTNSKNEPLFGVEIYIEEIQKGTVTNEDGYFELSNLPNHSFKLTIASVGYKTQNQLIDIKNLQSNYQFTLEESVFKMEEIIISTPFNKLQSENVMKVERATIQQLKAKGGATLIEGITSLPGVSQLSTGVGIGKPVIRGLRGNRVLVYSQGIRLENQQFGDEHGLGVDDSSIESVEVIKGPASLLYGSDALGGVLYFNPLKFAKDDTFESSFSQKYFSNTQGSSTSLGVKKSFNSWKFLANGTQNKHADYEIPSGERVTNTRFNEDIFNAAIGYNNSFLSSTLRVNYSQSEIGIPEEIGIQSTNRDPLLPFQDLENTMVSLQNVLFLNNNSKITSTFGYTTNVRKEFEEHHHDEHEEDHDEHEEEHLEPALNLKLNTFSYDVKWHLPVTKVQTVIGVQGLAQENLNYGEEILIPDATTNDIGLFITGSYDWNQHSLQAGLRFDSRKISTEEHIVMHGEEEHIFESIDRNFENVSASVGLKSNLLDNLTSRINIASGFRAPTLAELTANGVHHGSNRFEVGNNSLKSERNIQVDVSLEHKTKHLELFANMFYNKVNNYVFITPTGEIEDDYFVYEYVQDDAKLYGGEFGIHIHPHPLDWLHFNSNYEFVIGEQNNGNDLPLIPANKFTNILRTEFYDTKVISNGFAAITLESFFEQNKISEFETPTDSYNLVNIGIGGTITIEKIDFDINLNVNNLFDETYISHLSRLKNNGIPNIGRNFIASIKVIL